MVMYFPVLYIFRDEASFQNGFTNFIITSVKAVRMHSISLHSLTNSSLENHTI